MPSKGAEYEALIQAEVTALGLGKVVFTVRGSGHGCATFKCQDGIERRMFYTKTATDYRGRRNMQSLARRLAQGIDHTLRHQQRKLESVT